MALHHNETMYRPVPIALLCVLLLGCSQGKVEVDVNPQTGLQTWKTLDQDFSLELVPLLPDYVRAVFANKGLPAEVVEAISSYCVFVTIVRNEADQALSYDMRTWRYVTADGVEHRARPKSDWVETWREQGIAFRWLLLHEAQSYAVGDWVQGFTTVKLPPGTQFDLHYSWQQGDRTYERIIRDMACAPATLDN